MEEKEDIVAQQPRLTAYFADLIQQKKLVHAYLLVGPAGSGKHELALWIAAGLFCQHPMMGHPCGKCAECQRIFSGNHPDVIDLLPTGNSIKVEQTRFLKSEFSSSGVESRQKVIIIENTEKMTASAANSLLKFIEEPNGQVTVFLLAASLSQLLPTIVSRCQLFKMQLPSEERRILAYQRVGLSALLAGLTVDMQTARQLADEKTVFELSKLLTQWFLKILNNEWLALVDVQVKFMPLITDRKKQNLFLQLLELFSKDLLRCAIGTKMVYFQDQALQLNKRLKRYSLTKQLTAVELLLNQSKLQQENINFQNLLEALTLQLIKCYHG
ncbi:DNA polymerase III subunit delta' [Liquorilactobacillus sicerae]|uniref:DNA polymerase III subunit delta' n=1 Tax=Liquorilactobacillus sicerae TaxID=1416943 RepID=UPI002480D086|nr:DNA polymerase III subunit delta' [Liquorilactobacillus sicerae]